MTVAITGVGQTMYRRRHDDKSAGELVREAVVEALADAKLELDAIGLVVGGVAPDALAGINDIDRMSICRPNIPYFRVNTGGATGSSAVLAAKHWIEAGRADAVLVVALERMGQAATAQKIFNTIFDPIYEKDLVLTTITMAALRASILMKRHRFEPIQLAEIASRNFANAANNPLVEGNRIRSAEEVLASPLLAWPIHRYEACGISEGACAIVLTNERGAEGRSSAWVHGAAALSDTYAMGDRMNRPEGTLMDILTLERAAKAAYGQAGIERPESEVDVFELQAPFASLQVMMMPALGLCGRDELEPFVRRVLDNHVTTVFNPSGGAQAANPVSATALIRIAEAALQVRGKAGARQVDGVRRAVATGQGGATQFSTVFVLGKDRP
jgi:acetyl-CoA C-acetyltransferase